MPTPVLTAEQYAEVMALPPDQQTAYMSKLTPVASAAAPPPSAAPRRARPVAGRPASTTPTFTAEEYEMLSKLTPEQQKLAMDAAFGGKPIPVPPTADEARARYYEKRLIKGDGLINRTARTAQSAFLQLGARATGTAKYLAGNDNYSSDFLAAQAMGAAQKKLAEREGRGRSVASTIEQAATVTAQAVPLIVPAIYAGLSAVAAAPAGVLGMSSAATGTAVTGLASASLSAPMAVAEAAAMAKHAVDEHGNHLTQGQQDAYVLSAGAIDTAVNLVFGLTGGKAAAEPVKQGILAFLKATGINVTAAEIGAMTDAVSRKLTGVDPRALDYQRLKDTAIDAAAGAAGITLTGPLAARLNRADKAKVSKAKAAETKAALDKANADRGPEAAPIVELTAEPTGRFDSSRPHWAQEHLASPEVAFNRDAIANAAKTHGVDEALLASVMESRISHGAANEEGILPGVLGLDPDTMSRLLGITDPAILEAAMQNPKLQAAASAMQLKEKVAKFGKQGKGLDAKAKEQDGRRLAVIASAAGDKVVSNGLKAGLSSDDIATSMLTEAQSAQLKRAEEIGRTAQSELEAQSQPRVDKDPEADWNARWEKDADKIHEYQKQKREAEMAEKKAKQDQEDAEALALAKDRSVIPLLPAARRAEERQAKLAQDRARTGERLSESTTEGPEAAAERLQAQQVAEYSALSKMTPEEQEVYHKQRRAALSGRVFGEPLAELEGDGMPADLRLGAGESDFDAYWRRTLEGLPEEGLLPETGDAMNSRLGKGARDVTSGDALQPFPPDEGARALTRGYPIGDMPVLPALENKPGGAPDLGPREIGPGSVEEKTKINSMQRPEMTGADPGIDPMGPSESRVGVGEVDPEASFDIPEYGDNPEGAVGYATLADRNAPTEVSPLADYDGPSPLSGPPLITEGTGGRSRKELEAVRGTGIYPASYGIQPLPMGEMGAPRRPETGRSPAPNGKLDIPEIPLREDQSPVDATGVDKITRGDPEKEAALAQAHERAKIEELKDEIRFQDTIKNTKARAKAEDDRLMALAKAELAAEQAAAVAAQPPVPVAEAKAKVKTAKAKEAKAKGEAPAKTPAKKGKSKSASKNPNPVAAEAEQEGLVEVPQKSRASHVEDAMKEQGDEVVPADSSAALVDKKKNKKYPTTVSKDGVKIALDHTVPNVTTIRSIRVPDGGDVAAALDKLVVASEAGGTTLMHPQFKGEVPLKKALMDAGFRRNADGTWYRYPTLTRPAKTAKPGKPTVSAAEADPPELNVPPVKAPVKARAVATVKGGQRKVRPAAASPAAPAPTVSLRDKVIDAIKGGAEYPQAVAKKAGADADEVYAVLKEMEKDGTYTGKISQPLTPKGLAKILKAETAPPKTATPEPTKRPLSETDPFFPGEEAPAPAPKASKAPKAPKAVVPQELRFTGEAGLKESIKSRVPEDLHAAVDEFVNNMSETEKRKLSANKNEDAYDSFMANEKGGKGDIKGSLEHLKAIRERAGKGRPGPAKADTGVFDDIEIAFKQGKKFVEDLYKKAEPLLDRLWGQSADATAFMEDSKKRFGESVQFYARRFAREHSTGAMKKSNPLYPGEGTDFLSMDPKDRPPVWQSKAHLAAQKMPTPMDASNMQAYMRNEGVTQAEIDHIGLSKMKGKVTPEQVLEQVINNAVKVDVQLVPGGANKDNYFEPDVGNMPELTTPGGKDYTEMFFSLEGPKMWARKDRMHGFSGKADHNPLGWARFDTRQMDGIKTLLVQEIQAPHFEDAMANGDKRAGEVFGNDRWPQMISQKLLHYAVENGFGQIALTDGRIQNLRAGLEPDSPSMVTRYDVKHKSEMNKLARAFGTSMEQHGVIPAADANAKFSFKKAPARFSYDGPIEKGYTYRKTGPDEYNLYLDGEEMGVSFESIDEARREAKDHHNMVSYSKIHDTGYHKMVLTPELKQRAAAGNFLLPADAGMLSVGDVAKLVRGTADFSHAVYTKAAPHLSAIYSSVKARAGDLAGFVRASVVQFGEKVRPYAERFWNEVRRGIRDQNGSMMKPTVFGALMKKKLTDPEGILGGRLISNKPPEVQRMLETRENLQGEIGWETEHNIKAIKRAINSSTPRDERAAMWETVNTAMHGHGFNPTLTSLAAMRSAKAVFDTLPPEIQTAVLTARNALDHLTDTVIQKSIGSANTVSIMQKNQGVWMKRSYRVFDDPDWVKNVIDGPDWDDYAKQRILAEARANPGVKRLTMDEAKGRNAAMLQAQHESGTASYGMQTLKGRTDLSTLTKREPIADWTRAMMGEYGDFRVNYAKSAAAMGNMIANYEFQHSLRAWGEGTILSTKSTETLRSQFPIGEEWGPLSGMFTTEHLRKSLADLSPGRETGPTGQFWSGLSAVLRFNKTGGNIPRGAMRQLPSNIKMAIQAGHIGPIEIFTPKAWERFAISGKGALSALADIRWSDPRVAEAFLDAVHYGTLNMDPVARVGMEQVAEFLGPKSKAGQLIRKWDPSGRSAEAIAAVAKGASKIYMGFDNMLMINGFLAEQENYQHMVDTGQWTPVQLKEHAANFVKDAYPNRQRMMPYADKYKNVPFVADFVFYKSERLRNNVRILDQIWVETHSENPAIRATGTKRALGMLMGLAGGPALAGLISSEMGGVDADEDKAWRKLLSRTVPGLANSTHLFSDSGRNGTATLHDVGFVDSDEMLTNAATAVLVNDGGWKDKMGEASNEFFSNFFGQDMALQFVGGVMSGRNPHNGMKMDARETAAFAAKALLPLAVGQAGNALSVFTGKMNFGDFALEQVGPKTYRLDAEKLLQQNAYVFREAQMGERKRFSKATNADPLAEMSYKEQYNSVIEGYFDQMAEAVAAADKLGVSRGRILHILKQSGVSASAARGLTAGRFEAEHNGIPWGRSIKKRAL